MGGAHVASMGGSTGGYKVLVRKHEGKRPPGRPRRRWIILKWTVRKWDGGHRLD
jgi:hypothetical protein